MKKLLAIGLVFVIALTVVLALVVAGCGTSDEGTDATETTIATEAPVDGDTESTEAPVVETESTEAPAEEVTTTVAQ
jgi:hypothetical protein